MTRQEAMKIHDEEAVTTLEDRLKDKTNVGLCLGRLIINVDSYGFYHYSERKAHVVCEPRQVRDGQW